MKTVIFLLLLTLGLVAAQPCIAGYASFSRTTDTIQVSGGTILGSTATYEARVMLTAQGGEIYDEWAFGWIPSILP